MNHKVRAGEGKLPVITKGVVSIHVAGRSRGEADRLENRTLRLTTGLHETQ